MKRYVKEFANDQMKHCTEERKSYINTVLKHYKKGIITSFEAVELIVNSYHTYYTYTE